MKKYLSLFLSLLALCQLLTSCSPLKTPTETTPDAVSQTADGTGAVGADGETEGSGPVSKETDSAGTDGEKASQALPPLAPPPIAADSFPKIDGSTATLPISHALYRLVTGAGQREAEAAITHYKTSAAYWNLYDGEEYSPDLVIAYEPDEKMQALLTEPDCPLELRPIGRDALVFMANRSNPVRSLTREQIVAIYSGAMTNWAQTGGTDQEITAFQRPKGSGSQSLMDKLAMRGTPMAEAPTSYYISEMEGLLETVASYDNTGGALGYSVYYYARNMYQKPELRFMAVDGVEPSTETIRDGSYPYVNDFYAAIRKDAPAGSPARILFDWLTSDDGQALINGLGYVGIRDVERSFPPALAQETAAPSGVLTFPEGTVLLGDGNYLYGENGLAVFNSRMEQVTYLPQVSFASLSTFTEWDVSRPLILSDLNVPEDKIPRMGLYSLKKNRWLLEPDYLSITEDQDGYRLEKGVFDTSSQSWNCSYGRAGADGRLLSMGEPTGTRTFPDYFRGYPDNPAAFAEAYPELLSQYGASKQDVRYFYPISGGDTIPYLEIGTVNHYFRLDGTWLFDYDTSGFANRDDLYLDPMVIDDSTAILNVYSPEQGSFRHLYQDGTLIKTITPAPNQSLCGTGPHFYAVTAGNYIDIYTLDDQLCARFLQGFSRLD